MCTTAGVGASWWILLVDCEKCHELGCLGEEFLLLGFELLKLMVLCGCECGGMFLCAFKSGLETVCVLEDCLVVNR